MKEEILNTIKNNSNKNFFLLSGPCVIEGEKMALKIAEKLKEVTEKLSIPFVFKGSFKKANRSRVDSFSGIADLKALKILRKVSASFDIPVITDVHSVEDVKLVSEFVDVIQIPAFLVRQTDIIVAAARTGKIVNLKKGQFMSPESMKHAVNKVVCSGGDNTWITERGSMFGYKDMVVDFRGIPTMQSFAPTILDVTHSLQCPNQDLGVTGGRPEMIDTIARAGVAVGVDGLFIETHFDPNISKSDGANMIDLKLIPDLLSRLCMIKNIVNKF